MAKTTWRIEGIPQVVRRIDQAIAGIETRSAAAMGEIGLTIKADAMRRTPVDTGNLRGSAYVQVSSNRIAGTKARGGWQSTVEIGYTAEYAPFVHEMNRAYKVGTWKFLEYALMENEATIVQILQDHASIKGRVA